MRGMSCVALLMILAVVSCDQFPTNRSSSPPAEKEKFEMTEDKQGRTIRLNKVTGEMAVLEGSALVPVQSPEDAQRNANTVSVLSQAKVWAPTQLPQISKDTSVYLSTSWRDGKLYYQFWVTSSRKIKQAVAEEPYGNFQVVLTDAGGFNLMKITIPLNRLTRIIDEDGKTSYFSSNDSVPASQDVYRSISSYTMIWHF
jgi:hypothetical protein